MSIYGEMIEKGGKGFEKAFKWGCALIALLIVSTVVLAIMLIIKW